MALSKKMKHSDTTMFDYNELTIIGITLVLAQQHYEKGTSEWTRIEGLLKKIKEEQCDSSRILH